MVEAIPEDFRDLFEGTALAHLATVRKDGAPHVTPGLGLLRRRTHSGELRSGSR